jgi:hypothetical protein
VSVGQDIVADTKSAIDAADAWKRVARGDLQRILAAGDLLCLKGYVHALLTQSWYLTYAAILLPTSVSATKYQNKQRLSRVHPRSQVGGRLLDALGSLQGKFANSFCAVARRSFEC